MIQDYLVLSIVLFCLGMLAAGLLQLAMNFVQQVLRAQVAWVDHLARVLDDLVADAQARGDGQRVGTAGKAHDQAVGRLKRLQVEFHAGVQSAGRVVSVGL